MFLIGPALLCLAGHCAAQKKDLPEFRFDRVESVSEWRALHDLAAPTFENGAMRLRIIGPDPYLGGPVRDFPKEMSLMLTIRLRSETGGPAQIFYCLEGESPSEPRSVRFDVPADKWTEATVRLPSLGPRGWLRFDPPGTEGVCEVAWIQFKEAVVFAPPKWPKPTVPEIGAHPCRLKSGSVEVVHSRVRFGAFKVFVNGSLMSCGSSGPLIGYEFQGAGKWMRGARSEIKMLDGAIVSRLIATDERGGSWTITQRFVLGKAPGSIDVAASAVVNQPRDVVYLPLLILHPGLGSFGAHHGQALFCGLEYLGRDEESSSEKDLHGDQAQRLAPDSERITIPLMAIQQEGRYLSLAWEPVREVAALFDMPDRHFQSGANLMGLAIPGSDGTNRREGSLIADLPTRLSPGKPVVIRATISGGTGKSCVPAVEDYLKAHPLPKLPSSQFDQAGYVRWTAGGWLDSAISSQDGRYRHAYWPGFGGFAPGPAADVATFLAWLSDGGADKALAARLDAARAKALSLVPVSSYDAVGVSHVRAPVQSLLFGDPLLSAQAARKGAIETLARFEPDGRLLYKPAPGGTDYGATHFEPDANGLTASAVLSVLLAALQTGDQDLIEEGLSKLKALDRFVNSAPRGAQTWEVPLHTPDILASALLVRCYTIGYELTGEPAMLDKARYWAYTGIPFVYLRKPTDGPVGLYGTIPVYGATNWVAPNWMGLPVQWCGLVYSDALYWLARDDPNGPWRKLADGITISGIQQSFPSSAGELQGLLPDSFGLKAQTRNPVAINPGTVQANAVRLFGGPSLYDVRVLRPSGVIVHAPGSVVVESSGANWIAFRVETWRKAPYLLLIAGLKSRPEVSLDGKPVEASLESWDPAGRLAIKVEGRPRIEIRLKSP